MSLNKLTDAILGQEIGLNIGCEHITVSGTVSVADNIDVSTISSKKFICETDDGKTIDLGQYPDQGIPGHVLHTDGNGGTYFGPDTAGPTGVTWAGATTAVGKHVKSNSADGLTVIPSAISESPSELDIGALKVVNATDPTNAQDLTTKSYVDAGAVTAGLKQQLGSGLLSGGALSIFNISSSFTVAAGSGFVTNTSGVTIEFSWTEFNDIAIPFPRTYVGISTGPATVRQATPFTPAQTRSIVVLGLIEKPTGSAFITGVFNEPVLLLNNSNSAYDTANIAIGKKKIDGLVCRSPSGLQIECTSGTIFGPGINFNTDPANPNTVAIPSRTSLNNFISYHMKNGQISSLLTTVNPNQYDDGTNYPGAAVIAGYWTVQRIYVNSAAGFRVQLGQFQYSTLDDAINHISTEGFIPDPDLCLIAYVALQEGSTDLTTAVFINPSPTENQPTVSVSKLANIASVSRSPDITTFSGVVRSDTDPVDVWDLTRLSYVTGQLAGKLDSTGGTLAGNLTVNGDIDHNGGVYRRNGETVSLTVERANFSNLVTQNSGTSLTSGSDNVAYGYDALLATDVQSRNCAFGANSMDDYKGANSVAMGWRALSTNLASTGGTSNVAIGDATMRSQTNGSDNVCLGTSSGFLISSGSRNVALGTNAGNGITSEADNVCLGQNANTTGFNNSIAIGSGATATASNQCVLANVSQVVPSSTNNCDLGTATAKFKDLNLGSNANIGGDIQGGGVINTTGSYQANGIDAELPVRRGGGFNLVNEGSGINISTNAGNTAYGATCMNTVTAQQRNCAFGAFAMQSYNGNLSVAIGWNAMSSSASVGGNSNVVVGDNTMRNQTTGSFNTGVGQDTLNTLTTGDNNIAIGNGSLSGGLTTGGNNVAIGANTNVGNFSSSIALGFGAVCNASNQMALGQGLTQIVPNNTNACDIGSAGLQFRDLYLSGNAALSAGDLTVSSGEFVLSSPTVPTSTSFPGVPGQLSWDSGRLYICIAPNTWRRSRPLQTF